jgi:hypothetical protein
MQVSILKMKNGNFESSSFRLFRVFIGIKKLLDLIDMARYTEPQNRVIKFLTKLEDEGGLDSTCQ